MLTKEQNDLVTQTGPGTMMGDLFRCYWLPFPSARIARTRLRAGPRQDLSERLIAFRDSEGKLGLIDDSAASARRSVRRNEECGLRCPYHGWKFDE